jgi:hypothetical protein
VDTLSATDHETVPEVVIMKSLIHAVVVATILAAPVASFAQSAQPLTRAQVRAELIQLEKAGYDPLTDAYSYPGSLQKAEARVEAAHLEASSYGGTAVAGASQSGAGVVACR